MMLDVAIHCSVPTLTDDKLLNASVKEKLRAHLASLSRESSYEEKPMENDITDSRCVCVYACVCIRACVSVCVCVCLSSCCRGIW